MPTPEPVGIDQMDTTYRLAGTSSTTAGTPSTTVDDLLRELMADPDVTARLGAASGRPSRRLSARAVGIVAGTIVLIAGAAFAGGWATGRQTADNVNPPATVGAEVATPGAALPGAGPNGSASTSVLGEAQSSLLPLLVEQYRANLAARGFVSRDLTDDNLARFASTACVFASSADTSADFDAFRSAAAAQADTTLSGAEQRLVIDQAVATFCPREAERLGLEVAPTS